MAMATASVRDDASSFDRMLLTWNLTVDRLTISFSAISGLVWPDTIKASTSRSRSVKSKPILGGPCAAMLAWISA